MPKQRPLPNPKASGLTDSEIKNEVVLKAMAFGKGQANFHSTLEELQERLSFHRERADNYALLQEKYELGPAGTEAPDEIAGRDHQWEVSSLETLIAALEMRQTYLGKLETS